MSPMLGAVNFSLPLKPAFGRFLWDEVAIQQPGVQQRPISPGNGIPPHAHGFSHLPVGGSLRLKLVLADTMRVNDEFTERNVGGFEGVKDPYAPFSPKFLIF